MCALCEGWRGLDSFSFILPSFLVSTGPLDFRGLPPVARAEEI